MRLRSSLIAATVVFGSVMPLGVGAPAHAAGCELGSKDFNHDGQTDIVVGDPGATVSGHAGAGVVRVLYGGGVPAQTLAQGQQLVGGGPEAGDGFGSVIQVGDVNLDECTDVIVGVPSEDVGTAKDAGMVHVIYGSPSGLGKGPATSVWVQGKNGFTGSAEAGDRFGAALSHNDVLHSGFPRLLIGVPGEDIGGKKDAGMAYSRQYYFDSNGMQTLGTFAITQDSAGVDGAVEAGDQFGASVAAGDNIAAIGAPGETLGTATAAGAVHVFSRTAVTFVDYAISQQLSTVAGAAETGDRFGAAISIAPSWEEHLVVGVPGEDLGTATDAGMAHAFVPGQSSVTEIWAAGQGSAGLENTAESGDGFGQTVRAILIDDNTGKIIVAVGVPGEDSRAGAVQVLTVSATPGDDDVLLRQGQSDISGTPEAGDHFGAAIGSSPGRLLIGAPDDVEHSHGVVHGVPFTLFGGETGTAMTWIPGQDGVPAGGSRFGASLF